MYLISTDQGFIRGKLHHGLQFVYEQEEAGTYSEVTETMINDLHKCYLCEEIEVITNKLIN